MTENGRPRAPGRAALIIDADQSRRAGLGRWVGEAGFEPRSAETAEKARSELEDHSFALVLADEEVLDARGAALLERLSGRSSLPVTGLTLEASDRAYGGSGKPGLARFGRLVGGSRPMQRVYDQALRVASTDATVFLVGESGTGKELAAELIHGLSRRAEGPFVPINCGALSPGLIESELFGHERGSFTGADRRRAGLFERAQGGTLFLDEITEMPLDLQVKLLRVLESGAVRRVGGNEPVDTDVRVIAATNRDPDKAVEQRQLRADLFYRLLVFPIELPPLRKHTEDIDGIARHYLARLNQQASVEKEITRGAVEAFQAHRWPGNVRELRNAIEHAFIIADRTISEGCLAMDPLETVDERKDGLDVRVGMTISQVEHRLILATLERLRGDKKHAAKTLGISVKTLYSRLSVYRAAAGG